MGEHAKLPWQAQSDGWQPWPGAIAIKADDGYIIAYTTSGGKEKENTDLLCKATSSHDALVKALEEIANYTEDDKPPFRAMGRDQMAAVAREAPRQGAVMKGDHKFRKRPRGATGGGYVRPRVQIGFDDETRRTVTKRAKENNRSFAAEVRALVASALVQS